MPEKLCFQWNDFNDNVKSSFKSLRENGDFADVTLACEDGKQVEAHKVILATSSPFFQRILRKNAHPHPLIYMRGMKSEDLLAIIDFLYCGEANVYQENLDSFLAIAEELQLKGLMGKSDKDELVQEETFEMAPPTSKKPVYKKEPSALNPIGPSQSYSGEQASSNSSTHSGEVALASDIFSSGDLQELDEKCMSMMGRTSEKNAHGQPLYQCKVFGKEGIN